MTDFFGSALDFEDFDRLLSKDDLIEEPIPVERFVTDSKYLGNRALSDIQVEIVKHSTQIFKPETMVQLLGQEEGLRYYENYTVKEVVAQLGKGSGKDHTARISMAYIAYLLHCLRDPLDYYGKGHEVTVDLVNVAVNAKQAQQVFFDPLKKLLMSSPYFMEQALFEPRAQEIFFFERPIRLFSGHSESESWEGYEALIFVLDEIAAFKADSELGNEIRNKGSASQIYNMARASVQSRFPDVGKTILLSFPRFRGDFIQTRYNSVMDDIPDTQKNEDERLGNKGTDMESTSWVVRASTWDVNPTRKKSEFEDELRRDPIQAKARYMCEPPEMEDAYFREPATVRSAFTREENPEDGEGFKEWFIGTDNHSRFIHVDLAVKKDRAALAMVHTPGMKEVKTYLGTEKLPIVKMDLVKCWEAKAGKEIDFARIRDLIIYLARQFDVGLVTFDQYQSVEMIQSLRSLGINADMHNVKKLDYDTLSSTIYDKRFIGYWNEILVENELLKLQILNNNKIDHPTKGSKDLADAVAGATTQCVENMISDGDVDIEILGAGEGMDDELDGPDFRQEIVKDMDTEVMPDEVQEWLNMV